MSKSLKVFLVGLLAALMWPALLSAQGRNGIIEPAEEDTVSGIVIISGTAVDPNFLRYELAFRHSANRDWIVFAQGDQAVADGTLAVWDTTVGQETVPVFPDGVYELRLRVVRTDYNYDEYFATNIIISNSEPTPTPTATVSEQPPTAAPGDSLAGTSQPAGVPLPSLTPFPTPLPRATPVESISRTGDTNEQAGEEASGGVLEQITSIDTSNYGRAFWRGVSLVAIVFAALAFYLLFRGAFRRIWRTVKTKLFR
jgi:hypothetical protein